MNQERLMTVLLGPHVSEKGHTLADKHNQIVFRVRRDANKATDNAKSDKTLTEDDQKNLKDEIQEETKNHESKIDEPKEVALAGTKAGCGIADEG